MDKETFQRRYSDTSPKFERLRTTVYGMVQNSLAEAGIDLLQIQSRVKDCDSCYAKYEEKKYADPFLEITDFVGIRAILFLETDIDRAAKTLKEIFEVDTKNSVDKRHPTKVGSVGYRSLHIVASLGKSRRSLPEYRDICSLPFEIQLRTALQHAWAEIEHKRNYKGPFSLPEDLQHRLMTISGTLEMIDREFAAIAKQADEYATQIRTTDDAEGADAISSVALDALFEKFVAENDLFEHVDTSPRNTPTARILRELQRFGIQNVKQLRDLLKSLTPEDISLFSLPGYRLSIPRYYRTAMIKEDIEKYLSKAHEGTISSIEIAQINVLERALHRDDLEELFEKYGIKVVPF